MKKNISIRKKQNSRGVAVIFTLGILGLLTVMALGFASTALLNRKIADNTSSAEYARHIAKNIAFARAKWVVSNNLIADLAYSSGPISGEPAEQDFLHKMDTVLEGVELYRVTDDSGQIKDGTARWQYVKDSSGKILGRYAYAIVPDSGHLDPVGNRGQTTVSGRYGFSEKEIGVYSLCNGDTGLNKNADDSGVPGLKFRTFKEFVSAFQNLSDNNKKNFLKDGYRIQLGPAPDAFWIDDNMDGKKTKDELYLRFNMPATDAEWESMTVAKLIGDGAGESDSDIKYTSTTKNSVDFIPWLKYWDREVDSTHWTKDVIKKQIAANIIQYNRPNPNAIDSSGAPYQTVSDKEDLDWLQPGNKPSYAGIGRHPMLNEIGFSVTVKGDVTSENIGTPEEPNYKYTPRYEITIESGAELICPFFNPLDTTVPIKINKATVKFAGEIIIKLRKFKPQSDINNIASLDEIVTDSAAEPWTFSTKSAISKLTDGGTPAVDGGRWDTVDLNIEIPADEDHWNSSPAYTKAGTFWNLKAQKTVTLPPFTLPGDLAKTDQSAKIKDWLDLQHVSYKPGSTVMLYGAAPADPADSKYPKYQRDFADLPDQEETSTQKVGEKKWVYFVSYETKDPLVNHKPTDWTVKTATFGYPTEGSTEEIAKEVNKAYPGTVFDGDGGTSADDKHKNSTIPEKLLKDQENGSEVILESAADPAWTDGARLSSSYIRHEPMRSFWELGFISRAEAFKTLNLARTRVFPKEATYKQRGGGTFAQGDANILDQIKFSDTNNQKDAQGKININARYHKVFEWVFNKDIASASGTTVNWYKDLITGTATDPYGTTSVLGTDKNMVCSNSTYCLSQQHSDSCSVGDCLAHLLMERSRILPFRNRADLLLDPDAPDPASSNLDIAKIPGYSELSSTDQTKLRTLQRKVRDYLLNPENETTNDAKSKLVREQYASRFMNLLKADSDEHVYIIVVAQSIKDIGGGPAFVDWDGDGEFAPEDEKAFPVSAKGLKSGYVRKKLFAATTEYESVGNKTQAKETITETHLGEYIPGADKITGETKLIVEMLRDVVTGKWRIAGYRYVE